MNQTRKITEELIEYVIFRLKDLFISLPDIQNAFYYCIQSCVNEFWAKVKEPTGQLAAWYGYQPEYTWHRHLGIDNAKAITIIKEKVLPSLRKAKSIADQKSSYFTVFEGLYDDIENQFGTRTPTAQISAPAALPASTLPIIDSVPNERQARMIKSVKENLKNVEWRVKKTESYYSIMKRCVELFWRWGDEGGQKDHGMEWCLKSMSDLAAKESIQVDLWPLLQELMNCIDQESEAYSRVNEIYGYVQENFFVPGQAPSYAHQRPANATLPTPVKEVEELRSRVIALESTIKGFYTNHGVYDNKISTLEKNLASCQANLININSYISSQAGYKEIIEDFVKKSSKIDALTTKIDEIDKIEARVKTLENPPSRLKKWLTGKGANIDEEGHIRTLSQRIRDLKTER